MRAFVIPLELDTAVYCQDRNCFCCSLAHVAAGCCLQVGDGTTSVVVLAGELLREAEQLVAQKIHPMVIIAGGHGGCCWKHGRGSTRTADHEQQVLERVSSL
jgi:hypothetical protein